MDGWMDAAAAAAAAAFERGLMLRLLPDRWPTHGPDDRWFDNLCLACRDGIEWRWIGKDGDSDTSGIGRAFDAFFGVEQNHSCYRFRFPSSYHHRVDATRGLPRHHQRIGGGAASSLLLFHRIHSGY